MTGSTAIEDRLQDGVPEAISHIRKAGIKLWVLTGDKIETAINVGFSSGLLDDNSDQYVIDGKYAGDVLTQMQVAENDHNLKNGEREIALIISGDSLTQILSVESLREKFIKLIENVSIVIACRVSPKQKAEIVLMMKEQHPEAKTLAIGDGSNDVNMITAAHVGVGISGLEG